MQKGRKQTHHGRTSGFTLVELAIVVAIVGLLTAISIPNYMRFQHRAKETMVRENMRVIQSGIELFAVDNGGTYPGGAADAPVIEAYMPKGIFPTNPFTNAVTNPLWNVDPALPGAIAIFVLPGGGYMMKGYGKLAMLTPFIVVGD